MLTIDPWNIMWTIVNLLVLYMIFKKFLYKPVLDVINQRNRMVQEQFENAKKNEEDALQLKTEYQEKLKNARIEANQIILGARERAEAEHQRQIETTKLETEHMIQTAKDSIVRDQEKASKAVQSEISKLALIAAKKILETGEMHDTDSAQ